MSGHELYLGLVGARACRVHAEGARRLLPHPCVSGRPLAETHIGLASFVFLLSQAPLSQHVAFHSFISLLTFQAGSGQETDQVLKTRRNPVKGLFRKIWQAKGKQQPSPSFLYLLFQMPPQQTTSSPCPGPERGLAGPGCSQTLSALESSVREGGGGRIFRSVSVCPPQRNLPLEWPPPGATPEDCPWVFFTQQFPLGFCLHVPVQQTAIHRKL